jgi:hypothetical protein
MLWGKEMKFIKKTEKSLSTFAASVDFIQVCKCVNFIGRKKKIVLRKIIPKKKQRSVNKYIVVFIKNWKQEAMNKYLKFLNGNLLTHGKTDILRSIFVTLRLILLKKQLVFLLQYERKYGAGYKITKVTAKKLA